MGRDFGALLADTPCWNRYTQRLYDETGVPLQDVTLQCREELIGLCEFIDRNAIRSYLEIGVWTGRLTTVLNEIFNFDLVAGCDLGFAESLGLDIRLPFGTKFFHGDSHSDAFVAWRHDLGHIDLVMIDGDHSYGSVSLDWAINRAFSHRFIAFHDITGTDPNCIGVKKLWNEIGGEKSTIIKPNRELGLAYSTMGIGIVAAPVR